MWLGRNWSLLKVLTIVLFVSLKFEACPLIQDVNVALPFPSLLQQEHEDYEIIQSTNPEFNKAVVRVNIYQEHRQTVQVGFAFRCKRMIVVVKYVLIV